MGTVTSLSQRYETWCEATGRTPSPEGDDAFFEGFLQCWEIALKDPDVLVRAVGRI